jgi:hypothetical protein
LGPGRAREIARQLKLEPGIARPSVSVLRGITNTSPLLVQSVTRRVTSASPRWSARPRLELALSVKAATLVRSPPCPHRGIVHYLTLFTTVVQETQPLAGPATARTFDSAKSALGHRLLGRAGAQRLGPSQVPARGGMGSTAGKLAPSKPQLLRFRPGGPMICNSRVTQREATSIRTWSAVAPRPS